MERHEIIRAWKDEEFRDSLGSERLSHLPEHPAGAAELEDEIVAAGALLGTETLWSLGCCDSFTQDPVSGGCCGGGDPPCTTGCAGTCYGAMDGPGFMC